MKYYSFGRSLFTFIILVITINCCIIIIRNGDFDHEFSSLPASDYYYTTSNTTFDCPVLNTTLLKLSETDPGESHMKTQSHFFHRTILNILLTTHNPSTQLWRPFSSPSTTIPIRRKAQTTSQSGPNLDRPKSHYQMDQLNRILLHSHHLLINWTRHKHYNPNILSHLVDLIRVPIDGHHKKYTSCAVVGNSGILLNTHHGNAIDAHEAVFRLNNPDIDEVYSNHIGSRTTISFVNSNIIHLCSRRRRHFINSPCNCYPYPVVLYICHPTHFLDYASCCLGDRMVVTDPRFDVLCTRIVKYYSLRGYLFDGSNIRTVEGWSAAHDGMYFHYSSGMQAVMMAVGLCERVSLYGFGKNSYAKHRYFTDQKSELGLHDYEAEYELYRDLVERPYVIPFVSDGFNFPPVEIHR